MALRIRAINHSISAQDQCLKSHSRTSKFNSYEPWLAILYQIHSTNLESWIDSNSKSSLPYTPFTDTANKLHSEAFQSSHEKSPKTNSLHSENVQRIQNTKMATNAKTVILTTPKDWEQWLYTVKLIADEDDIWGYIDPDLTTAPAIPSKPIKPTANMVNPTNQHLTELTPTETNTFNMLLADFKEEKTIVKTVTDTLKTIKAHIGTTVHRDNIVYILDITLVHNILLALKQRLAPTDRARKIDVIRQYTKLKTWNKRQDVETWLKEWETTYTTAKKLKLAEVFDERPLYDFIFAISSMDSAFAGIQENQLDDRIASDLPLPTLYSLIEKFRNHRRRTESLNPKSGASHSAFASLGGENETRDLVCLCSGKHRYSECNYLKPANRTEKWQGKPATFKSINQKLDNYRRPRKNGKTLKEFVISDYKYDGFNNLKLTDENESTQPKDNSKDNTIDSLPAVDSEGVPLPLPKGSKVHGTFMTVQSTHSNLHSHSYGVKSLTYKLYDSWTLDNASDVHLCNDINRSDFQKTHNAHPNSVVTSGKES